MSIFTKSVESNFDKTNIYSESAKDTILEGSYESETLFLLQNEILLIFWSRSKI